MEVAGDAFALAGQREQVAGGAQHRFGPEAFGDVAHDRDDAPVIAGAERGEADLDRHLAAVLALERQLHARPHRASPVGLDEAVAERLVAVAGTDRHQHVDARAEEFGGAVARHLEELLVDDADRAVGAAHDQSVGKLVDPGRELGIGVLVGRIGRRHVRVCSVVGHAATLASTPQRGVPRGFAGPARRRPRLPLVVADSLPVRRPFAARSWPGRGPVGTRAHRRAASGRR